MVTIPSVVFPINPPIVITLYVSISLRISGRCCSDSEYRKFADEIRSKALAYSGELLMSDIMNEVLCERGIASKAVSFDFWPIITDNNIESTNFLYSESEQHLPEILRLIETYSVITMGGFIGKTTDGIVTTYERGGSDRTAVDMGILLHKKFNVSINFEKDFAVYSADPRIVKDGSMINELSYNEARLRPLL